MKAMVVTQYGSPDVFNENELPDPHPGPGQVSIDVTHSAVGLIDVFVRRGTIPVFAPPFVPGLEVAGTIREIGEGVTGFRVGEPVVTLSLMSVGGYASITVADAALTISLAGFQIDPALAVSALPNAVTAYLSLTRVARMQQGERILIHGAIGGLAAAYPAVARSLGASRIVGTVRTASKLEAARRLDYDEVVLAEELAASLGDERFSLVVDPVGGDLLAASLELMEPLGRALLVGNASEQALNIASTTLWLNNIGVQGFNVGGYLSANPSAGRPAAEAVLRLVEAGLIDIPLTRLPLGQAAEAHRRLEAKDIVGRIVLQQA
ncbi:quinone oxidoreductase family protein [Paenibacillus glycinis]|uniref:Zinc-binding dehydrogenase n=1 Tax=Paenibacillus glycinis TaxID=2697035 RepID=A0ABW9XZI9_9BACL|nr:zinc-binding dehydrogenase [Paenibacillus glycinis]NBD28142.1 zinc-binding dehydrogenase [Paenibacillus glycinis]